MVRSRIRGACHGLWLVVLALAAPAIAHDSWLNSKRSKTGESCCGENDCSVLPPRQVSARPDGYHIWVLDGERLRAEIVPYAEALPSQDNQFWRCRRPDGSRRCFFRPVPTM